jgi:hypothetical protein
MKLRISRHEQAIANAARWISNPNLVPSKGLEQLPQKWGKVILKHHPVPLTSSMLRKVQI